jgi:hypothetical protein
LYTYIEKIKAKFGKKEDIQKREKPKKQRIKQIGRPKGIVIVFWFLFFFGFAWSLYKNFTAIDQHTVHETKVIEEKIVDTNAVESFVRDFASRYYKWESTQESVSERKVNLENFMIDELIFLNGSSVDANAGISSAVNDIWIWSVERQSENQYEVIYSVEQEISKIEEVMETSLVEEPEMQEIINEKTGKKSFESVMVQKEVERPVEKEIRENHRSHFIVTVHMDEMGNMVIVKNPTISSVPQKSEYKPKAINNDTVDSDMSREVSMFLENFFKFYPAADESVMEYYVEENTLPVIMQEYTFADITDKVFIKDEKKVNAYITVKFTDDRTGVKQYSQYRLVLEKKENWKIIGSN